MTLNHYRFLTPMDRCHLQPAQLVMHVIQWFWVSTQFNNLLLAVKFDLLHDSVPGIFLKLTSSSKSRYFTIEMKAFQMNITSLTLSKD